eukprot:11752924-Karenia_brevis.AAC.1
MLIEHDVTCNTAESLRDVPKTVWDPMGSVCSASGSDGVRIRYVGQKWQNPCTRRQKCCGIRTGSDGIHVTFIVLAHVHRA